MRKTIITLVVALASLVPVGAVADGMVSAPGKPTGNQTPAGPSAAAEKAAAGGQRGHSQHQRCRADGCTIPATWTETHHLKPWAQGGNTDLADGISLCSHHHHLIHDHRYTHQRLPDGDISFHRRT